MNNIILQEQVRTILEEAYINLIKQKFSAELHKPPSLNIRIGNCTSYYDPYKNEIHLWILEWDAEAISNGEQSFSESENPKEWPVWQLTLIEELIHAYQKLVKRNDISPIGQELHSRFSMRFEGICHGPEFFTTLATVAEKLGVSPELLASLI